MSVVTKAPAFAGANYGGNPLFAVDSRFRGSDSYLCSQLAVKEETTLKKDI
jgi:hypothetical protein